MSFVKDIKRAARAVKRELGSRRSSALAARAGRQISEPSQADIYGSIQRFNDMWANWGASATADERLVSFCCQVSFLDPTVVSARRFLKNLIHTKLKTVIDDRSDSDTQKIINRLNDTSKRLRLNLMAQQLIDQALSTGAFSHEAVIGKSGDRVDRTVLVPTQSIKFKLQNQKWVPHQRQSDGKDVELPEETYRYTPNESAQGSPYGIPTFISAISSVLQMVDIDDNLKYIFKKYGLLGMVTALISPPDDYDSGNPDDVARLNQTIADRLNDFAQNYKQGLMIGPNDMEMNIVSPTSNTRGADALIDRVAERIHSGTVGNGALIGQSDRPADKFANVIYRIAVLMALSFQVVAAEDLTWLLAIDLALAGIDPTGVRSEYEENPAFDPLAEKQGRTTEIAGDIQLMERGLMEPDDVAMKYTDKPAPRPDLAYGMSGGGDYVPELMNRESPFPLKRGELKELQAGTPTLRSTGGKRRVELVLKGDRYEVARDRVEIYSQQIARITQIKNTPPDTPPASPKLTATGELSAGDERRIGGYVNKLKPHLRQAGERAVEAAVEFLNRANFREFINETDFADQLWNILGARVGGELGLEEVYETCKKVTDDVYRYYRLKDSSVWGGRAPMAFQFSAVDYRVLEFAPNLDQFYLGKFALNRNATASGNRFLREQYLEHGAALFGRSDPAVVDAFRTALGHDMNSMTLRHAQTIADTSVVRMRAYGSLRQMVEAEVDEAEWVTMGGPCDICAPFDGKRWQIGESVRRMAREIAMSPGEFAHYARSELTTGARPDVQAALDGGEQPPLHPNCRCRIVAVV